eukprot:CAMPEP_0174229538 /NCGR_PEP_ID=MMETSP0417-20130205/483_1 /TAXON_ID=242541 /ORGANISM="Mayorella sp, Strain BSH-02190019" /LENGTH=922 /DNA_ID=CAMNT_0015307097 /DNA_START=297 /DNA_END=3065 /DNA_ORIENTATION=+
MSHRSAAALSEQLCREVENGVTLVREDQVGVVGCERGLVVFDLTALPLRVAFRTPQQAVLTRLSNDLFSIRAAGSSLEHRFQTSCVSPLSSPSPRSSRSPRRSVVGTPGSPASSSTLTPVSISACSPLPSYPSLATVAATPFCTSAPNMRRRPSLLGRNTASVSTSALQTPQSTQHYAYSLHGDDESTSESDLSHVSSSSVDSDSDSQSDSLYPRLTSLSQRRRPRQHGSCRCLHSSSSSSSSSRSFSSASSDDVESGTTSNDGSSSVGYSSDSEASVECEYRLSSAALPVESSDRTASSTSRLKELSAGNRRSAARLPRAQHEPVPNTTQSPNASSTTAESPLIRTRCRLPKSLLSSSLPESDGCSHTTTLTDPLRALQLSPASSRSRSLQQQRRRYLAHSHQEMSAPPPSAAVAAATAPALHSSADATSPARGVVNASATATATASQRATSPVLSCTASGADAFSPSNHAAHAHEKRLCLDPALMLECGLIAYDARTGSGKVIFRLCELIAGQFYVTESGQALRVLSDGRVELGGSLLEPPRHHVLQPATPLASDALLLSGRLLGQAVSDDGFSAGVCLPPPETFAAAFRHSFSAIAVPSIGSCRVVPDYDAADVAPPPADSAEQAALLTYHLVPLRVLYSFVSDDKLWESESASAARSAAQDEREHGARGTSVELGGKASRRPEVHIAWQRSLPSEPHRFVSICDEESSSPSYSPSLEDVGCLLRAVCTPVRDGKHGVPCYSKQRRVLLHPEVAADADDQASCSVMLLKALLQGQCTRAQCSHDPHDSTHSCRAFADSAIASSGRESVIGQQRVLMLTADRLKLKKREKTVLKAMRRQVTIEALCGAAPLQLVVRISPLAAPSSEKSTVSSLRSSAVARLRNRGRGNEPTAVSTAALVLSAASKHQRDVMITAIRQFVQ